MDHLDHRLAVFSYCWRCVLSGAQAGSLRQSNDRGGDIEDDLSVVVVVGIDNGNSTQKSCQQPPNTSLLILVVSCHYHHPSAYYSEATQRSTTMSPTKAATTPISEEAGNKENNPNKGEENSSAVKGPPSAIEFEPPLACVRRILKHSLPSSTNVGKDASAAFARASGIFIIYLTACANDFARENRRQTITANDVLAAIKVSTTTEKGLDYLIRYA